MFEASDSVDLTRADPSALVATIAAATRAEAAAAGTRLAAIAELLDRNLRQADPHAAFDGFAAATAEVGAAMGISPRRAAGQVHLAKALRHRFPKVAALLRAGAISERVASVICWRTYLVAAEAAPAIDTALQSAAESAGVTGGLGCLSDTALGEAIDAAIAVHDPDATRTVHESARRRDIRFGKPDDQAGTTSLFGSMLSSDAVLADRTITELVATVCPEDPRTLGERRSDAMGVLMNRGDQLPCRCNRPDCPQNTTARKQASPAVIHVLADQDAIEAATLEAATQPSIGTPWLIAQRPPTWIFTPQAEWTDTHTPEQIADLIAAANPHQVRDRMAAAQTAPEPAAPAAPSVCQNHRENLTGRTRRETRRSTPKPPPPKPGGKAVLLGGSFVPGPLLAELVRSGAKITALKPPPVANEPQYRPSSALAWFARARDMTCCFPGCNVPAEHCDIDHRIPWPAGPTHPGNTGCFCRTHHLAKTFAGWNVIQGTDGTVTWTSPHGAVYRNTPGGKLALPDWNIETPLPPRTETNETKPAPGRSLAMPRRRRTRAAEERSRIATERAANHAANLAYDAKMEKTLGSRPEADTTPGPAPPQTEDEPPF